jgi:hypothetical protein
VVEGWELVNGLLFYKGRIFVPKDIAIRKLILESHHDAPAAGHPGQACTLELVNRQFYWPSMKKSVNQYVEACDSCNRTKPSNRMPHGELQSIEPPLKPWDEITYDLITGLPESEGFDAVLTFVD